MFNFAFLMGWFYFELTQVFLYFYRSAVTVLTREVSKLSVVYDMKTYFYRMMTGMFDRVYNLVL